MSPTTKQKKAVKEMAENGGIVSKAMREVGYSENTLNTPQKLTESKGYQVALKEYGLTEELITISLVDDIKAKPKNRLGELRLGSEILNMKETGSTFNVLIANPDQARVLAERLLMITNDK